MTLLGFQDVATLQLNSVIISFIETQRLTLSREKKCSDPCKSKCKTQCPKLKLHNSEMKEADSIKYLGNIVTSNGGVADTIEDCRNKG